MRQTLRVEHELEAMLCELAAPVQLAWTEILERLEATATDGWRPLEQGLWAAPRWRTPSGLVLRRRRWRLDGERVHSAEEFVALAARSGLPDELFVTVAAATTRAGHKPRFVHVGIPALIEDCLRQARRLAQPLLLEEALPARGLSCSDGRFAASVYLEWERAR